MGDRGHPAGRRGATAAGAFARRGVVLLLLAVPGIAQPYTLERLLRLPLEQLLQLEITVAPRAGGSPPPRPSQGPGDRRVA